METDVDRRGDPGARPEDAPAFEIVAVASSAGGLAALTSLPEEQREVFVLREVQGLDTGEICKILAVSVTNFGVLMHRARARLRREGPRGGCRGRARR